MAIRTAEFLADHDGVIETTQALNLGMTRDQVHHKTDVGLWRSHARSVFLSAEHHLTDMAAVRIASLAHQGATVDRSSAAWLHGLIDEAPSTVTMSVPRSVHGTCACSILTEIRRRSFPSEDLTTVRGIRTTALPLTVLAAAADLDDGIAIMDRALQTKRVSLRELRAALDRNSGSHGMRNARRLLTAAEGLSESELERKFVRFLRKHRIRGWQQQVWLENRRLDFVWPEERIAVSLHGWAFHHDHDRWERDQETTNMLTGMGWLPLIFTWKRLEFEPDNVLRELSRTLELRQGTM
ncbi:hypothetical protein ACH46_05245 [Gordonia phthalatica]|uniref:Uncharacterized protein n=1 Tax=Gordonia phthalatica TaxID=1136941 RepID=A0A0N9NFW1_9ACTN|nr:hypothetical protein ACH46_05245 [Gordonia phthalatica]